MTVMRRLDTRAADFTSRLAALTRFEATLDEAVERTVAGILADVQVLLDGERFEAGPARSVVWVGGIAAGAVGPFPPGGPVAPPRGLDRLSPRRARCP